ncbi:MAG: RNA polymerase sigma factor [Planctomycetota bacterium]|nr:RNA polymerase sigma factor [Planctomycetota bacterium]
MAPKVKDYTDKTSWRKWVTASSLCKTTAIAMQLLVLPEISQIPFNTAARLRIINMYSMTDSGDGQAISGDIVTGSRAYGREEANEASYCSFAAVWPEVLPDIRRLVMALGVGVHAAEDILQDVYIAALGRKGDRLDRKSLRRWLFRVAINRCYQESRKHRRRRKILRRLASWFGKETADPSAGGKVALRDEHEAVRSVLETLDERLKAPLVLRYYQDMNSKEIAKILGIPDSTVRSRLREAREKLAAELRKAGYGDE